MNATCLQVKVKLVDTKLKVAISEFCGFGLNYIPLLVDEGYLFVDFKGVQSKIFVMR